MENNVENIESRIKVCLNKLIIEGPKNTELMEELSRYKYLEPKLFSKYENQIILYMGLFYKKGVFDGENNLQNFIFSDYANGIYEQHQKYLTPVQSDILNNLLDNEYFFFSAPTSIGKSYLLREIILDSADNVVIIVPSRALINEYIDSLNRKLNEINEKSYNVLPFIDLINTKYAKKNIYVLTPERCLDLFKTKINVEYFIFDESQLIDSSQKIRSLKYRLLLQKIDNYYKNSKKLFAAPFVENISCFVESGLINTKNYSAVKYEYKTVGQMFIECNKNKNEFSIFSLKNPKIKIKVNDPIRKAILENKKVLIYSSKRKIYNGEIYDSVNQYIDLCQDVTDPKALEIIKKVKENIGATNGTYNSVIIDYMRKGVVIHHGSLPQTVRKLIESFIKEKYANICIATSTLQQGVNMPFDLIYLYELRNLSKAIDYRNLIGRAGRSTDENIFDYGIIVINSSSKKTLINRMREEALIDINQFEIKDDDYEDLKHAIENDLFDDELKLPVTLIEKISNEEIYTSINQISHILFDESGNLNEYDKYKDEISSITRKLRKIYEVSLHNRELNAAEQGVFTTAIRIMLWKFNKMKFSEIVCIRYSSSKENWNLPKAQEIPNKYAKYKNVFYNISDSKYYFDLVVYDTYEYIDTVINISLKDFFVGVVTKTILNKYDNNENRSFLYYLKYGSIDKKEVLLYRYGFDDEEIQLIMPHVIDISEECIIFNESINSYRCEFEEKIKRFIYGDNVIKSVE